MAEQIDLAKWMSYAAARRKQLRDRKKATPQPTKKLVRKKTMSHAEVRQQQARKQHGERSDLAGRHIEYARVLEGQRKKKASK